MNCATFSSWPSGADGSPQAKPPRRWDDRDDCELEDAGAGADRAILDLAMARGLTAYDAAYLALARERGLPLATLDESLARAARLEGVVLLGPLA